MPDAALRLSHRGAGGFRPAARFVAMSGGLYSRLLGDDWFALAENVRRVHSGESEIRGTFRISHGSGWLARQLLRGAKLPAAAGTVDTRLKITPESTRELWVRRFDRQILATEQWEGAGRRLIERVGNWVFSFKLRVTEGSLRYEQDGAGLFVGAWQVLLPRICAPRVCAQETTDGHAGVLVSVSVSLPLAGLLLSYEGRLDTVGGAQ